MIDIVLFCIFVCSIGLRCADLALQPRLWRRLSSAVPAPPDFRATKLIINPKCRKTVENSYRPRARVIEVIKMKSREAAPSLMFHAVSRLGEGGRALRHVMLCLYAASVSVSRRRCQIPLRGSVRCGLWCGLAATRGYICRRAGRRCLLCRICYEP